MNDATTTVGVTAGTLEVPGARLHYELRGRGPLVLLVGAPMDATAFAPLADRLAADHTVLTTDPRGIRRSPVDDPDQDSTPEMRAEDLSRLLAHVGAGPAAAFGSSGGAVSVLALAQAYPEQVHTVIAHEPPLEELLDDRDALREQTGRMVERYLAGDVHGAWTLFLATANIPLPAEVMLAGDRGPQAVADEHFQFAHMLRATAGWRPDLAALRAAATRIVVGIGTESAGQICDRTSRALAAGLGLEPAMFPGDHIGFVQDPARFETRLRAVLGAG